MRELFTEKPVPLEGKCTLCYQCKKICPAGAIDISDGEHKTPTYNYKKCIRCYCCKEICPEAAISLKKGALQWMML
jgi:formate hydrogenlyase subunit 6/NADH:ubiquinone oxidoreductase subunit I